MFSIIAFSIIYTIFLVLLFNIYYLNKIWLNNISEIQNQINIQSNKEFRKKFGINITGDLIKSTIYISEILNYNLELTGEIIYFDKVTLRGYVER